MIFYKEYTSDFYSIFQKFTEELQDHIVSLDTQERVIRHSNFGAYYAQKIISEVSKQGGKIILAFDEDKVIGVVVALILKRNDEDALQLKPAKYGEIEKLYVLDTYRGKGVGSHLFKMAEKYLVEEEKCDYVEVVVFGDNDKAYDLYKKLGYADREFILIKKVSKK